MQLNHFPDPSVYYSNSKSKYVDTKGRAGVEANVRSRKTSQPIQYMKIACEKALYPREQLRHGTRGTAIYTLIIRELSL
jgi:hypothetical protein